MRRMSGIVSVIMRADNEAPGVSHYAIFYTREQPYEPWRWRLVVDYQPAGVAVDPGRRRPGGDVGTGRERRPRAPLRPSAGRAPLGPSSGRRPKSWWASP